MNRGDGFQLDNMEIQCFENINSEHPPNLLEQAVHKLGTSFISPWGKRKVRETGKTTGEEKLVDISSTGYNEAQLSKYAKKKCEWFIRAYLNINNTEDQ